MKETLVSTVVPVYNAERHLEKCIESICAQPLSPLEIILVDDGSTDGSGALCEEWARKEPRIRVIHKENGGVSSARNAGIEVASGQFITFCDSDDYLEPDYLATLLETAEAYPDCGHVWCCFQTVTGYQRENAQPNYSAEEPVQRCTLREYMTLHERWLDTLPWNKLYRADVIRKNALRFSPELSLGEDWLFNLAYLDASQNDRIAVVTRPLYNYVRGSGESLDSRYRSDLLDIYRRLNAACASYLQKWSASPEQLAKFYDSRFFLYEKVLRNTMRAPDMSRREKLAWNDAFLRSEEFCQVLRERTCFVHPLYLAAYRSGHFANILLLDWLHRLKSTIKRT